jgi:nucleoid-associated protein YgaU
MLAAVSGHRRRAVAAGEGEPVGIFSRKKDDKKKADFSNVQSGSSSTAAEPSAPPPSEPASGTAGQVRTYVVAKGDSLSKIAKHYYGDANQWRRIYDANRDQITNPDLIHPGQTLKIPGA